MAEAGCSEILSAGENWRRCFSCRGASGGQGGAVSGQPRL
jgi:hypothetical protein